jgi:hypothetical protein
MKVCDKCQKKIELGNTQLHYEDSKNQYDKYEIVLDIELCKSCMKKLVKTIENDFLSKKE